MFVPGFGQTVKVVLNSFLHRRFDGRPSGRTRKSQRERHVDRGSGHTFDRDDVSDRGDTVADALVLNWIDGRLNAVDKVRRRDSPVAIYKDDLHGSAAIPHREHFDGADALKKFDLCFIVGLVSAVCLGL